MSPNDHDGPPKPRTGNAPTTVVPTNRVTVAFPFSTIKIHEPDERVRRLAEIVADLADQLATIQPSAAAAEMQARAHACASELAS